MQTSLPHVSDPRWKDIITGKIAPIWTSVAAQMLMFRVVSSVKKDPSSENIEKQIKEVYSFFEKNQHILQNDIKKI
ncbi:MAG: hypothetical protein HEEMFOPI_00763 [Holosporales bacterium]